MLTSSEDSDEEQDTVKVCVWGGVSVHVYMHVSTCMWVCMYMLLYVSVCTRICTSVCVPLLLHIEGKYCTYICMCACEVYNTYMLCVSGNVYNIVGLFVANIDGN